GMLAAVLDGRRGKAVVDLHITADPPAQLLQSLEESRVARLRDGIVGGLAHQHADAPHALALLRPRRNRPCRSAADERDELASSHQLPRQPWDYGSAGHDNTRYHHGGCARGAPDHRQSVEEAAASS